MFIINHLVKKINRNNKLFFHLYFFTIGFTKTLQRFFIVTKWINNKKNSRLYNLLKNGQDTFIQKSKAWLKITSAYVIRTLFDFLNF